MQPVTITISGPTTPERLVGELRKQAPHLFRDGPPAPAPAAPEPRGNGRPSPEALMTPAEVADVFRVDRKTVTRWAKAGKLTCIRTLGGHRRYRKAEAPCWAGGRSGARCPPSPDSGREKQQRREEAQPWQVQHATSR